MVEIFLENALKIYEELKLKSSNPNNMQFLICSVKWHKRHVYRTKTHAIITCKKCGRPAAGSVSGLALCAQAETTFANPHS